MDEKQNSKPTVVMVCVANNGRSPVAEAAFRHQLESSYAELANQVKVISRGSHADEIFGATTTYERCQKYLTMAVEHDRQAGEFTHDKGELERVRVFSTDTLDEIMRNILSDKNTDAPHNYQNDSTYREYVNHLAVHAQTELTRRETRQRIEFLKSKGLATNGRHRQQFNPSPEFVLILCMEEMNVEKINEMYRHQGMPPPQTHLLLPYAGIMCELPRAFGIPDPAAFARRDNLVYEASIRAADRFAGEYKPSR